jgi:hypothetical protein
MKTKILLDVLVPGGLAAFAVFGVVGCLTAPQHRAAVETGRDERLSVGTVQKEIHLGMSGAQVIEALGSPNIVATDEERREVWTYDKIATEVVHSSSGLSLIPLLTGGVGSGWGAAAGSASYSSGAVSRSQRTLTVIVKFDADKRVRDFAFHASSF